MIHDHGGSSRRRQALLLGALLSAAACERPADTSEADAASVADTPHVLPEEETFFTDVPVDGFDRLSPLGQAAVAARANRAKCECGCFGHSINACLHLQETCEIAVRTAERFVADERLAERVAGIAPSEPPPQLPAGPATGSEEAPAAPLAIDPGATAAPAGPTTEAFAEPPLLVATPPSDPLPPPDASPVPAPDTDATVTGDEGLSGTGAAQGLLEVPLAGSPGGIVSGAAVDLAAPVGTPGAVGGPSPALPGHVSPIVGGPVAPASDGPVSPLTSGPVAPGLGSPVTPMIGGPVTPVTGAPVTPHAPQPPAPVRPSPPRATSP